MILVLLVIAAPNAGNETASNAVKAICAMRILTSRMLSRGSHLALRLTPDKSSSQHYMQPSVTRQVVF